MYQITKETMKRNILKFLQDEEQEELCLFSFEEDEDSADYGADYYSISKTFNEDLVDEDELEENGTSIEELEEDFILQVYCFEEAYIITNQDLSEAVGKTTNHKIANYVISDLSNVLNKLYSISLYS